MATGYGLDDRGIGNRVPAGSRIFSTSSRPALGFTQPIIQRVPGALSPRVKRTGREDDHSPPASTEVKKMWINTSTAPYAFMAYLIKHRDNFTFTSLTQSSKEVEAHTVHLFLLNRFHASFIFNLTKHPSVTATRHFYCRKAGISGRGIPH
jgi:hypothetical protein